MLVERVDAQKWATGVVVGVLSPQGRHVVAYGTMGLNDKRVVNGDTVFEIASLTKIFTALLLADMAREGKVNVNAPVSTCLPATVKVPRHNDRQITFVDLATHTSGLPLRPTNLASQLALNKYAGYTQEQLYRGLADFTLTRDAGAKFEYSNWGFGLLANALAYCAGQSYETLLHDRVTQPLGMEDTQLDPTPSMRTRLASGYDGNLKPVPNEGRGALDGAGSLYSTVNDLLKFVALFLGQGPPSLAASPATMLEPRRPGDDPHTQMALGWRVSTANGKQSVWSAGRADGYRSYMAFDPEARIAVVALANAATTGGVDDIGRHVLDPTVQVAKAHKWITVAAPLLDRYLGRYRFDDDGTFLTVTRNGTQLIMEMSGQGSFEVFPTGVREFFPKDIEAQFLFADPGTSASASVVLNQDGQSYLGKRVPDAPAEAEKP
jgi:CubicO group peptidase (beta-lactamase class C family)